MYAWYRRRKIRVALVLALALVLLAAVPVSAGAPEVITEVYSDFDHLLFPAGEVCEFAVWDDEVVTAKITTWYDEEGNPLRQEIRYKGVDNFHMENSDVVLSGKFSATVHTDMRTGKSTITGTLAHITEPGLGTVLQYTGRWDAYQYPGGHLAGKDSFNSAEDLEQFCSLLAGN